MSTRSSSLSASPGTAISREIDSKYDVIKEVSLHLVELDIVAAIDLEQFDLDVDQVAADLVLTNQDTIDTAADVVTTNADVATTNSNVTAAQTAQGLTETARDAAAVSADFVDDLVLGAKAGDPTTDNDGNVLQVGAVYYNTTLVPSQLKIWDGSVWNTAVFDATGVVTTLNGRDGAVSLSAADVNLSNADNTTDVEKPVSTAQQTALDTKVDDSVVVTTAITSATFNADGSITIVTP
jgi:hypothetical protein